MSTTLAFAPKPTKPRTPMRLLFRSTRSQGDRLSLADSMMLIWKASESNVSESTLKCAQSEPIMNLNLCLAQGIRIQYRHGDKYPHVCNQAERNAVVYIICNPVNVSYLYLAF